MWLHDTAISVRLGNLKLIDMEDHKIARVAGVAVLGVALASLFHYLKQQTQEEPVVGSLRLLTEEVQEQKTRARQPTSIVRKASRWGRLMMKDVPEADGLLEELRMMSELTAEFQKIPNIIIDNGLLNVKTIPNPIIQSKNKRQKNEPYMTPQALVQPGTFVLNNARVFTGQMLYFSKKWLRAGARNTIFFRPQQVKAAIVTCGGLSPGINNLIKELVVCLRENYKVPTVYGIRYSFKGFLDKDYQELTMEEVKTIHHQGGSYLGISRSNADIDTVVGELIEKRINHLYIIGGEGSLRACETLHKTIKERKLEIAVCVIPKSVTNDIPIVDKSFGFQTAVAQTQRAIQAAYVQAQSHQHGIGIIKTMGRNTGFLAVNACIAARNTQACLVPEFPFDLGGEKGVLHFIQQRVKVKKSSVIVLSDGCNESIRDYNLKIIGYEWDGEPIKEDIGLVLKREIKGVLEKKGIQANVKYIDPSYLVRDVPANAFDTKMCCQIAQASVDGLMSGYTNFACGHVANKLVMIPVHELLSGHYSNKIQKHSKDWVRLLATTGQPTFLND